MSDPIHKAGFDHPCKETCSGWKQGYDRGYDKATELMKNTLKANGVGYLTLTVVMAKQIEELKTKLQILRRYHGGDGSITREQVIETLGVE